MAGTVACILAAWAAAVWGPAAVLADWIMWAIDRLDRLVNPRTRERVRRHKRILAEYRREIAAKNERE